MLYRLLRFTSVFNLGVSRMLLAIRYFLFLLTAISFYQTNFGAAAHGNNNIIRGPLPRVVSVTGLSPLTVNIYPKEALRRLILLGKGKTAGRTRFTFVPTKAPAQVANRSRTRMQGTSAIIPSNADQKDCGAMPQGPTKFVFVPYSVTK